MTKKCLKTCVDQTHPRLVAESRQLRQILLDNKTKEIKFRYLTEITKDDLYYCKELLSTVDELHHIDGIHIFAKKGLHFHFTKGQNQLAGASIKWIDLYLVVVLIQMGYIFDT